MTSKELISLLKISLIFVIITFITFIIFVNVIKLVDFIIKIDDVLKVVAKEDNIPSIKNDFNLMDEQSDNIAEDKSHTAKELGYVDKLSAVNGSEWGSGINLLIVGSDKKNFQISKSRADVIILLRITESGKIMSISIPRDTLIKIPEGKWAGNEDKIGHSLYWGGLDDLKKNIENLTGSPVYKVIIIDNFRSFEAFLSIIGGIYIDKNIEGKTGIQWIRNRNFKFGDVERCRRQQLFFEKAMNKIWKITKGANYFYINFFYDALKKIVQTDLTKDEFLNIIYSLKENNFDPSSDFYVSVLPGEFDKYNSKLLKRKNLTCWIPSEEAIQKIQFLFYSEKKDYKYFYNKKIGFWNFLKIDLKLLFKNGKSLSKEN